MTSTPRAGVLFDVDGTLLDTAFLHTVCWWEALRQTGRVAAMSVIGAAVGMGSDQLLEFVLGSVPDDAAEIAAAQKAIYRVYWPRLNPLPGARDLIKTCAESGLVVILASSAKADELAFLRTVLDCEDHIHAATSADDADRSKPDPGIVLAALDAGHLDPDNTVFIGDAVWDVHAARDAGLQSIGLASGATSEAQLSAAGAIATYPGAAQLLQQFATSPLSRLTPPPA